MEITELRNRAASQENNVADQVFVNPALNEALEQLLLETYSSVQPNEADYEERNMLVQVFNTMARNIYGSGGDAGFPKVEAFGSFTMDLFTRGSDLDLSINFSDDIEIDYPRVRKIKALRQFARALESYQNRGIVCGISCITGAKVPVLKFIDCGTQVECDISIENKDGITRSQFFKLVLTIDGRFRILSRLMKLWAKACNINCPRDRTLSSMSIVSLVAFHLQTRNPPILPPFSLLLQDGREHASVEKNVQLFNDFGRENKESVATLFMTLMIKLSAVESLWQYGLCASNYEGSWISKSLSEGGGNISVEDFLDKSQNFARCVGYPQVEDICECLRTCVSHLSQFMNGKMDALELKSRIFGPVVAQWSSSRKEKRKRDDDHRGLISAVFNKVQPVLRPIQRKRAKKKKSKASSKKVTNGEPPIMVPVPIKNEVKHEQPSTIVIVPTEIPLTAKAVTRDGPPTKSPASKTEKAARAKVVVHVQPVAKPNTKFPHPSPNPAPIWSQSGYGSSFESYRGRYPVQPFTPPLHNLPLSYAFQQPQFHFGSQMGQQPLAPFAHHGVRPSAEQLLASQITAQRLQNQSPANLYSILNAPPWQLFRNQVNPNSYYGSPSSFVLGARAFSDHRYARQ